MRSGICEFNLHATRSLREDYPRPVRSDTYGAVHGGSTGDIIGGNDAVQNDAARSVDVLRGHVRPNVRYDVGATASRPPGRSSVNAGGIRDGV